MPSTVLSALCALALVADAFAVFMFEPENSSNVQWTGSLSTGKNDVQFIIISQHVSSYGTHDFDRASVLDLDILELRFIVQLSDGSYPSSDPSRLAVGVSGDGFEVISDGNFRTMRTHGTHEGVTLNLIYHRTTLPLVNGGPDIIFHDSGKTYGWGRPACSTYGTIFVKDQATQIDTKHSLTWYCRRWGSDRSYTSWTWFHLHLPGGLKLIPGQAMARVMSLGSTWRQFVIERDP
ncbi:hypothetical protein N7504_006882 [Penicillium tannophilum]|nr:hypothetical protein N7504_006882 [Penicillium tannophilum]